MIDVSVIIPHKNCVDLVIRCIKTIPDTSNIEIIVVDDNSDNQKLLREEIESLHYTNLKLILTHEGKGAGFARNRGLEVARGNWVIFADADDFFTKEAFKILGQYTNSIYDIIYFKHNSVFSNTLKPCQRYNVRDSLIDDCIANTADDCEMRLRYKDVVPWSKMFRRSISVDNSLLFDEVPASNDVMFVVKNAYHARQIYASQEIVYTLTYREGSITRIANKENNMSRYMVSLRYNQFVKMIGRPEMRNRVFSYVMLALRTFGVKEAVRYIRIAHQNHQWLFTGGIPGINELFGKISFKKKSNTFKG